MTFEDEIMEKRKKAWIDVVICLVAGAVAITLYELCSNIYIHGPEIPRRFGKIMTDVEWLDVFVETLIVYLMAGIAWYRRGEQRDDIYTEIIGKSTFALKHFRDRISDEIEARECEKKSNVPDVAKNGNRKT